MRTIRALLLALPLSLAALPASAQYVEERPYDPRYDPRLDPRFSQAPWSGVEDVAAAAHRLSQNGYNLSRLMRRVGGYSPLAVNAARFALAAERFHQAVEAPASYEAVLTEFTQLQADYHALRGVFFNTHRTHHLDRVVNDWTRLTSSFERLALAMGVEDSRLCAVQPYYNDRPPNRYGVYPR